MHVQFCFAVTKLQMKDEKFRQTHFKQTQAAVYHAGWSGHTLGVFL